MITNIQHLILLSVMTYLCLGWAHAGGPTSQILSEREMASAEGGFCTFSKCQTGVPTGKCQPHPPTMLGLCPRGTCRFVVREIPLVGEIDLCILFGHYTCTGQGGYRKCIAGSIGDVCWNSDINVCGTITQPACTENIQNKTCNCSIDPTNDPCDWTNCLLE
jgi:hypothetical protein